MSYVVETNAGSVVGKEVDGVDAWLGIPFGQGPVGALRFKRRKIFR